MDLVGVKTLLDGNFTKKIPSMNSIVSLSILCQIVLILVMCYRID